MISQRRIARIRALHRKKERQRQDVFLVEGIKNVQELLMSELEVLFVTGTPELLEKLGEGVSDEKGKVEFVESDRPTLESCSTLQHPEGVLALARMPQHRFDPASLSRERPLLCFEALSDPGNLGTLLRIADHFDLGDILFSPDSVDPYNPKVVRSSMGSLFRQRPHLRELAPSMELLKEEGRNIVATTATGPSIYSHPLPKDAVLLFGSESSGLSEGILKLADEERSLPAFGRVESLNVAVSAGIFCSELLRGGIP